MISSIAPVHVIALALANVNAPAPVPVLVLVSVLAPVPGGHGKYTYENKGDKKMTFIIVSTNCTLPRPPVVLTKDSTNGFLLKKDAGEVRLNTMDTTIDNILPDMGSSLGNVFFIIENEFQIDPLLEANTEKGFHRFNEAEQTTVIEVSRIILGKDEVLSYHFDNLKTARRFIEKKIFNEFYILKTANFDFIFYPQLKEIYLFSSSFIEVGFLGLQNCGNTLSAPSSVTVTELPVEPNDKKSYKIENTSAIIDFPMHKKYRLDFNSGPGMYVIRMKRGKREMKDGAGNSYLMMQDEILKFYIS